MDEDVKYNITAISFQNLPAIIMMNCSCEPHTGWDEYSRKERGHEATCIGERIVATGLRKSVAVPLIYIAQNMIWMYDLIDFGSHLIVCMVVSIQVLHIDCLFHVIGDGCGTSKNCSQKEEEYMGGKVVEINRKSEEKRGKRNKLKGR